MSEPTTAATMCEAFQATVAQHPRQVALRTLGGAATITWQQYAGRVRQIAAGLAGLGVRRGDMLGKTPAIERIGISYMLMGEVGADFDHPEAKQPPEGKDWYHAGPHVMFVSEGAGRILKGLGRDTTSGLPYVRPIPGAEPLLVAPIALPGERACGCASGCSCGCNG